MQSSPRNDDYQALNCIIFSVKQCHLPTSYKTNKSDAVIDERASELSETLASRSREVVESPGDRNTTFWKTILFLLGA